MRILLFVFVSAYVGCASKQFAQDMMPDGKTWMVKAYKIPCPQKFSCRDAVKSTITDRGKRICGAQPFRVMSCDMKNQYYGNIEAHCLLKCGEKPIASGAGDEIDFDDVK
ncbi:MAG: hypothetical protein AB7F86_13060 [Bdellovibrionales bacterium]